jgi:hypothetical protein
LSQSSFFGNYTTVNVLGDAGDLGDIVVSANGTVLTIDLRAVTLAKLQDIDSGKIIGRYSSGEGSPELITIGAGLSLVDGVLSITS